MSKKSIIGAYTEETIHLDKVNNEAVHITNTSFWNTVGSDVLGVTALPNYGAFISENSLNLFSDVGGKTILEIGCGNGHSLKYIAEKGAKELWGIDISQKQIDRTKEYLSSNGISANLVCAPMENECGIPKNYFDYVYSVYAIGWTTDLNKTFYQISSYLKSGGTFIFSWSHPIHKCVSREKENFVFSNSYFDESWYSVSLENENIMLSDRMLSTYINALSANGFVIEKMVEENDKDLICSKDDDFAVKANILPVTFVIKARKI